MMLPVDEKTDATTSFPRCIFAVVQLICSIVALYMFVVVPAFANGFPIWELITFVIAGWSAFLLSMTNVFIKFITHDNSDEKPNDDWPEISAPR